MAEGQKFPTCSTCKHFVTTKSLIGWPEWDGLCARIKHGNGDPDFIGVGRGRHLPRLDWRRVRDKLEREVHRLNEEEKAAVVSAKYAYAELRVKPDFGCVLHEERP